MPLMTKRSDVEEAVELIVRDEPASGADDGITISAEMPLLATSEKPKINIFTVSYTRRKPREQKQVTEIEISSLTHITLWVWSGSRYSGLLCMALSSIVYFLMQVISDVFSVQSIPLFETTFTRCIVISILSYLWLRRSGQPIFGPTHARNLLISRALMGCLSLFTFVYCVQRLPLSQAVLLSFSTPIMASIAARIILREKLKTSDIGGFACSFFGVLFIFILILSTQGGLVEAREASNLNVRGSHHIFVLLVGLFSSITGGISYCLVKAGAKASDQPVLTLFSFGILASPAAGLSTLSFEEFMLPGLYSFLLMLLLGVLAFFAEVLLARGLQLEKTSKVANVQYIGTALSQLWGIGSSSTAPPSGLLVGCIVILISVCYTMYIGPEEEINETAVF